MANVDISVIIPSKNNKNTTAKIIRCISESTKNLEVEYIVIDMNSTDNSILSALNEIKKHNLRGCVIQSGGGSVSSALNTGIYKSDGKYITFVYPSRLYKSDYIPEYYSTIEEKNADIVFSAPKTELVSAEMGNIDGSELAIGLVRSVISMDFCAVMIRREYLLDNHIKFYEDCVTGYAEAFVFNALLNYMNHFESAEQIQSNITMQGEYFNAFACEQLARYFEVRKCKLPIEPVALFDQESFINDRGAKVFIDSKKQPFIQLTEGSQVFEVLSVGADQRLTPTATILKNGNPECFQLPAELSEWVTNMVGFAAMGMNLFPAKVVFTYLNGKYYADIL